MPITPPSRAAPTDTKHPRYLERLASVGPPYAVVEVRVADTEDRELPVGETGEVLVRGDSVMVGYWSDPQSTASALRGSWLHTGDLGSFDADGVLTLKDRSKDLIISRRNNIYPRGIEGGPLKRPRAREAPGAGSPHADWGQVVVAL